MEILLAFSPLLVTLLTQVLKKVVDFLLFLPDGIRVALLRALVVIFSFLSVFCSSVLSGQPIDPTSLTTVAQAILVFLGASGLYFLAGRKTA